MSYLEQAHSHRPGALAGAIVAQGALAALLIVGLKTTVEREIRTGPIRAYNIPESTPKPPPPPPKPQEKTREIARPKTIVPPVPRDLSFSSEQVIETTQWPDSDLIFEIDFPPIGQSPVESGPAASNASGPKPRGNMGRWVTDADYKPRWLREGLSGQIKLDLTIGADGRVADCLIARSSGHAVLDEASCKLLTKRARFEPARDAQGKPARGTFSTTIRWKLPD